MRQCVLKMEDVFVTGDPVSDVIQETAINNVDNSVVGATNDIVRTLACKKVNKYYVESDSVKLFDKLCPNDSKSKHEGFMTCEENCRKKRCVDRYDSSESSDSGVAVLSCTDCSGSSTASSDIADPGSPFSTASSHSEDSGSQPVKMPPTQTAHHPPWPWTADDGPPCKRPFQEKTTFPKLLLKPTKESQWKESQISLNASQNTRKVSQKCVKIVPGESIPSDSLVNIDNNNSRIRRIVEVPKMQQGKITEYFKSQVKSNVMKKNLYNLTKGGPKKPCSNKLIDQQTQFNSLKLQANRRENKPKKSVASKVKKVASVSIPRKILPAPCNVQDKITINEQLSNIAKYTPAVTLTALSFPPNYTYLHTKTSKRPDTSIYVQQFATMTNDKIHLPIINRTQCLNVIQPLQKMTTINNFNCVKLNAVVPIVKVNALSSRLNGSSNIGLHGISRVSTASTVSNVINTSKPTKTLNFETAVPTVLYAKSKLVDRKHENVPNKNPSENVQTKCRLEDKSRTEDCETPDEDISRVEEKSTSLTDSDSGISNREYLEVSVSETLECASEQQKSPILSQPKTIRFPVKQDHKDDNKSSQHSAGGRCRWAECNSRFDTSGALLEHLQVKHVISQATQEHYVCLWLGCKVHGRSSCSRSWLERHVLAHAGTKPFRCIVDGCGQRFNSQLMLERHVNGHFNSDGSPNGSAKKSTENGVLKLFKRNGKRIRFRRQPWSARMFDFIDSGIMEGLQFNLLHLTQKRTLGKINKAGDTFYLQSQILARRIEVDGTVKYLLRWHPNDIVPDEWVSEKEYNPVKHVSIPSLHPSSKAALKLSLFSTEKPHQKQRRKAVSKQS